MWIVLAVLASLALSSPSRADEPEAGQPLLQELFMGETANGQDRGEVQVTLSGERVRPEDTVIDRLSAHVEYGVTDWLQAEVDLPYVRYRPAEEESGRGWGNVSLGAMVAPLRNRRRLALT